MTIIHSFIHSFIHHYIFLRLSHFKTHLSHHVTRHSFIHLFIHSFIYVTVQRIRKFDQSFCIVLECTVMQRKCKQNRSLMHLSYLLKLMKNINWSMVLISHQFSPDNTWWNNKFSWKECTKNMRCCYVKNKICLWNENFAFLRTWPVSPKY